jgi:hypothetical protein
MKVQKMVNSLILGRTEMDGRTDVVFTLGILFNISSRNVKPEVYQFLFVVHATCPY